MTDMERRVALATTIRLYKESILISLIHDPLHICDVSEQSKDPHLSRFSAE